MTKRFVFHELCDRHCCLKFPNTKCKIVKHQLEIIQTNPWQQNNHATLATGKIQLNNNRNFFSKNPIKPINVLETSNWGSLVKIMRKTKGFFSNVVDTKYDLLNLEKKTSVVLHFSRNPKVAHSLRHHADKFLPRSGVKNHFLALPFAFRPIGSPNGFCCMLN